MGLCSRLLADFGASVIRVEKPGGGPVLPGFSTSALSERPSASLHHHAHKQSITLDLAQSEGRELFLRLAAKMDGIVESAVPGTLEAMGLGYSDLSRVNPRLILLSLTGFGQEGPKSRLPCCDLVAAACGGAMAVCGVPDRPPLAPYGTQPAYVTSLYGAVAMLLALRRRSRLGRGSHLDLSAQECVVSTLDHVLVRYLHEGIIAGQLGGMDWNQNAFFLPCRDGHLYLTLPSQWETLVEWLAAEGMAGELVKAAWKDEGYRRTHLDRLRQILSRWTRSHSVEELFQLGQAMRFPWAPVFSPAQVLESPQLAARCFWEEGETVDSARFPLVPGLPYRFTPPLTRKRRRVSRPGEDNQRVYEEEQGGEELGLSDEAVVDFSLGDSAPPKSFEGCNSDGILKGVRVLDFTWVLAGPFATRLLGDFGAEVIKVQSLSTAKDGEANLTGYFSAWNRNKKSLTLDMRHPEAREIAFRLSRISDVVIENFSPRVMANWGLTYERLKVDHPGLIMVSLSAMGSTGPWRDGVGFGQTFQALTGLTWLTSYEPETPVGLGYAYSDHAAGLYAALAVLAALEARDRTGEGFCIDLSQYEAAATLVGPALLDAQGAPEETPGPTPAPCGCYRCTGRDGTDRWCVIAVNNEGEWQALRGAMSQPAWAGGGRFATAALRSHHEEELDRLIGAWTSGQTPEAVVRLLSGAGIPAAVVQNAADLAADPQLVSRGFFRILDHPVLGPRVADASPIRFRDDPASAWRPAPLLGADNVYVLKELLGLSDEELTALTEKGALA